MVRRQPTPSDSEHSLLDLSLDELMQVTVTSVSKKAQRLDETAAGGGEGPDDWHGKQAGFRLDASRGKDSYSLQGGISDYRAGDEILAFTAAPPYATSIQDDIALSPNRWRLTLGSRVEHNSHTGFEVQPNLRLLWTPNKEDSVWAALSRAVRTPSRGETASTVISLPPQPPLIPISTAMVGDPDMNAEKLEALDLGWRRQWAPTLTSEVAAFYYRYADLRAPFLIPGPLFLGTDPYQPLKLSNAIGAEAHGLELSMDWLPLPHWRLQANTSLFHIRGRDALYGATDTEFIGSTPGHQISLRSSLDITPRLQWDTWLRHVGRLRGGTSSIDDSVPAYTSLDMRLAWKPNRDLSIALVGQNLLDPTHLEKIAVDVLSDPVEIERAVYVKVDWKF